MTTTNFLDKLMRKCFLRKLEEKEKYFICLHSGDTCFGSEDIPWMKVPL